MAFDTSFANFVDTYFEFQQRSLESPEHQQAMAEHRTRRASALKG